MATEFVNYEALKSNLESVFGAGCIIYKEENKSEPYMKAVSSGWIDNTSCTEKQYRLYVKNSTGMNESIKVLQVMYNEVKANGKCCYLGEPSSIASAGTFSRDIANYFKSYAPDISPTQIISMVEYYNGDRLKSSALVIALKADLTAQFYRVIYNGSGAITHEAVAAAEGEKYIKYYRGL